MLDVEDRTFCHRFHLDAESLADDIARNGQIHPVTLRPSPKGDGFQIVCGFRRVEALLRLARRSVAATIRPLSDDEAMALSWSENVQRRSYSQLDRALAVLSAVKAGKTFTDLEAIFGLKRRWIRCVVALCLMSALMGVIAGCQGTPEPTRGTVGRAQLALELRRGR